MSGRQKVFDLPQLARDYLLFIFEGCASTPSDRELKHGKTSDFVALGSVGSGKAKAECGSDSTK